jgi:hypothetical protein
MPIIAIVDVDDWCIDNYCVHCCRWYTRAHSCLKDAPIVSQQMSMRFGVYGPEDAPYAQPDNNVTYVSIKRMSFLCKLIVYAFVRSHVDIFFFFFSFFFCVFQSSLI